MRPRQPQSDEHELLVTIREARKEIADLSVRLEEAERMAAALNLEKRARHICEEPLCHAIFYSTNKLAEHAYLAHGGPEPEHWKLAESRAAS